MPWTLDRAARRTRPTLVAVLAATALSTGCAGMTIQTAPPGPAETAYLSAAGVPTTEEARALLDTLPVKGRAPKTGYDRDRFGDSWSDDVDVAGGHNGCDTRNDILARDLTGITHKPGTRDCVVATGTLADPYTGTTIDFRRGQHTSAAVQIDHVVALSDAWQKGAQQLDPRQRRNFANDPRNLLAVDGPANQRKSDSDAASWLPPNKPYRCVYVAKQIDVKAAYALWVTRAEKDAMTRVLDAC
ncbi:HNH endonuclease [Nocardia otitidiscaviarum]|uniref:HNH endonuclease n=1 Tax=Nocardia otitidiscaviarum TaxID=1823 RepID=A0A516NI43_9NOCA|nr:HNH endonuclease family protein [Nocardia otitidiscaviarum]QDP78560.1 HNH endonuclease [Nocardia otitidiscaviarum]